MSEEVKVDQPVTEEVIVKAEEQVGEGFWGNPTKTAEVKVETKIEEKKEEIKTEEKPNEEILDPNVYLKNKWGWDSEEAADAEIKTLREKASKAFEYKNEESKRIAEYINEGKEEELYKFLDTKAKVKKLSTADLSDKNVAAELVKFGLHKDNPTLLPDEIDFLFNEKYSIPEKPKKGEDEEDADYDFRVGAWEVQKSNIEKRMIIEAKIAQPKMAQLNTELALAPITKETTSAKQPTPEELDKAKKVADGFLQDVELGLKNLTELSVMVKDEAVEIPVSYAYTEDEKKVVLEQVKTFVSNNYDTNEIFGKMWTDKDGNIDIPRMVRDLAYLNNQDKITNKLANDSANKRLYEYTKEKKNINLPGVSAQPNGQVDATKAVEQVEAAMWGR